MAGGLFTLLLAILAVVLALRHGLQPLDDVIETADAVADGERDQRIPTEKGASEIRRLAVALDCMLQQQRVSEARLRQLISDASHQLQTPLTLVLGWALLQRKGALDEAGQLAAVARIESEAGRMSVLVADLLLARLDEHRSIERREVQLVAIAADAVTDARAVDRARRLSLDAPGRAPVLGDPDGLRQVVDNLLRNVRVHTPPGTPAEVSIRVAARMTVLTVEDSGPGLEADHLGAIFDRFWRRDGSRNRATGGAGLGLAIVKAMVHAHGGTVAATNRPAGGARLTVERPAALPQDPVSGNPVMAWGCGRMWHVRAAGR